MQDACIEPKFVDVDREIQYFLPPFVQDWLHEGHLAWFVVEKLKL